MQDYTLNMQCVLGEAVSKRLRQLLCLESSEWIWGWEEAEEAPICHQILGAIQVNQFSWASFGAITKIRAVAVSILRK